MDLLQEFKAHWKQNFHQLSAANCHLIIAVSGGVDSVVLTDLIFKSGFDCTIAHCNFQLRTEASKTDELFVSNLSENYGKEVLIQRFETENYANEHKLGIQEAARILRYQWFAEILNRPSAVAQFVLTAHHADDNIETVLMNFCRGTGIQGFTGIPAFNAAQKILRPLLPFKKQELIEYAAANHLSFTEDASNATDKYSRNYFRNKIIPVIKEVYANAETNITATISRMNEADALYHQAIALHKKNLIEQHGDAIQIPILKLQKSVPLQTIIWEIIKAYHFSASQISEVIKLLDADNGSCISSASHRIIKNRKWLIIAANDNKIDAPIIIEKNTGKWETAIGQLQLKSIEYSVFNIQNNNSVAALDASKIKFPLLLRKWKQGDYFYPLGMMKKKKLSKFFIDKKLSMIDKENVWVMEMDKKIIWVINHRIDERFKVTDATKEVLEITLKG